MSHVDDQLQRLLDWAPTHLRLGLSDLHEAAALCTQTGRPELADGLHIVAGQIDRATQYVMREAAHVKTETQTGGGA